LVGQKRGAAEGLSATAAAPCTVGAQGGCAPRRMRWRLRLRGNALIKLDVDLGLAEEVLVGHSVGSIIPGRWSAGGRAWRRQRGEQYPQGLLPDVLPPSSSVEAMSLLGRKLPQCVNRRRVRRGTGISHSTMPRQPTGVGHERPLATAVSVRRQGWATKRAKQTLETGGALVALPA